MAYIDDILKSLMTDTPVQTAAPVLTTAEPATTPAFNAQTEKQKTPHVPGYLEILDMQDQINRALLEEKQKAHENNLKMASGIEANRFNVKHPYLTATLRGLIGDDAGGALSLVSPDTFNSNVARRTQRADDNFQTPVGIQETLDYIKLLNDPMNKERGQSAAFREALPGAVELGNSKTVAGAESAKSTAPRINPVTINPDALLGTGGQIIAPTEPQRSTPINNPVAGFKVTSPYGAKRGKTVHNGIDVAAPFGTPLKLNQPIKVVKAWYDSNGGHQVKVKLPDGSIMGVAHLKNKVDYAQGAELPAGTVFGYTGGKGPNSGHSTGPHAHLTIRDSKGVTIDPQAYFAKQGSHTQLIGSSGKPMSPIRQTARAVELPQAGALSANPVTVPGVTPTTVPIAQTDPNRLADLLNSVAEKNGDVLTPENFKDILAVINGQSKDDVALQRAQQALQTEVNTAPLEAVTKQTEATKNTLDPFTQVASAMKAREAAALQAENDRLDRETEAAKINEQRTQFYAGQAAQNERQQAQITATQKSETRKQRVDQGRTYRTEKIAGVDKQLSEIRAAVAKKKGEATPDQKAALRNLNAQRDKLLNMLNPGDDTGTSKKSTATINGVVPF